jgi:hypothetical protein
VCQPLAQVVIFLPEYIGGSLVLKLRVTIVFTDLLSNLNLFFLL